MTTFTVINDLTSGTGSLRQSILDANLSAGSDIIDFDNTLVGPNILLGTTSIDITDDLTIDGDWNDDGVSDFTFRSLSGSNFFSMTADGVTLTLDHFALDFDASGTTQDNAFAIQMSGNNQTFVNNSDINIAGYDGNLGDRSYAIGVTGNGATIDNSGDIVSAGRYVVNATRFSPAVMTGEETTVVNSGLMEAADDVIRISAGTITNSGTIRSTGAFDLGGLQPAGFAADAISVFGTYDASFTHVSGGVVTINNSATGLIEGYRAGIIVSGGGDINNDGTITALGTGVLSQGTFEDGLTTTFELVNTGSIFRTNTGDFTNGFSGTFPEAAVMIGGGNASNSIFNSGTISSTSYAITASEGVDVTNTSTGLIESDNDGLGNDGVAFKGAELTDFEVIATIGFPSLDSSSNYISAQGITILANGNWNIPGEGEFALPNFQVAVLYLSWVDAPVILALVDIAATVSNGFVTFQTDANGDVFPATIQVPTVNSGILTVNWVSGVGAVITDANGDTAYAPSATTNYADVINNEAGGQIIGDVITGLGDDTITNAGTIDGDVNMGVGNDVMTVSGTVTGDVDLGDGDDVFTLIGTGTVGSVDGGAGDDTIAVGLGTDIITGGAGADIIQTSATFSSTTETELDGDTITDFSVEDLITFNSGFNLVAHYDFTNNGDGTGTLGLGGSRVLNFTGLNATDDIVVISDRLALEEVRLLDNGILDLTLDEDRFDFAVNVGVADIDIAAGTTLGVSSFAPGVAGQFALRTGTDISVDNAGTINGTVIVQSDVSVIENTGSIGSNGFGISVSATNASVTSSSLVTNGLTGSIVGVNGITVQAGNILNPAAPSIANTTIVNDGTITAYFTGIRAGAMDTLDLTNNGTISTIANPNGGSQSSQGLVLSGSVQTNLTNTGVIEVTSSFGGYFEPIDGFAVLASGYNGDGFTLVNSGRISSTGSALMVGGMFDEDAAAVVQPDFVTTITNTATGIIEADTNNSNTDGAEYAITGTSGGFVLVNTPDAIYEAVNRFAIDNDGLITGNISLYEQDFFLLDARVFFPFNPNGSSIGEFEIPGAPKVQQDVDVNGDPVYDNNGGAVFTPGSVTSTFYGVVNYVVDPVTNLVTLTDINGDSIFAMPDAVNIDAGGFDDVLDNSGTIDGTVHLGIGEDMLTNSGTITGDVMLGLGDDSYTAVGAATAGVVDGGAGDDVLTGAAGDDAFLGGDGNDTLVGGAGSDSFDGGAGDDMIFADTEDDYAMIFGGTGVDTLFLTAEDVTGFDIVGQGFEIATILNAAGDTITEVSTDGVLTTRIDYDLAGNFDWVTRTALTDVNDSKAYQTRTDFKNAANQLMQRATLFDDGRLVTIDYDIDGTQTWDTRTVVLDTTGAQLWNTLTIEKVGGQNALLRFDYDDGTSRATLYDLDDSQNYQTQIDVRNDMNQLTQRITLFDDGRQITNTYDVEGLQTWTRQSFIEDLANNNATRTITSEFNGSSLASRVVVFDTDRIETTTYDLADEFAWARSTLIDDQGNERGFETQTVFVDETNQLLSRVSTYSDGRNVTENFDVAGVESWDRQTIVLDAADFLIWTSVAQTFIGTTLESRSYVFDTGITSTLTIDVNDDFDWAESTQTIDSANDVYSYETYTVFRNDAGAEFRYVTEFDDGRRLTRELDLDGTEAWDSRNVVEDLADAQVWTSVTTDRIGNDISQRIFLFDDGVERTTLYDLADVQTWARFDQSLDLQDAFDWSVIDEFRNDSNQVQSRVTTFDDGLRETFTYDLNDDFADWSFTRLREDLGDNETWTTIEEFYDDAGVLYDTITVLDA